MGTPGQLIVRRYRLVRALGQGSMGIVWEGHDMLLDRPVAVRQLLLPPGLSDTRRLQLTQRVAREARQAERLRHPNIAGVFEVAEEDGTPYVVMELVRSRSLDGIVASDGPLTPEKAASIGRQVLAALTHAHARGVQHGDVRPSNVLIGHDGRVLLADFGTAALAAHPAFRRPDGRRSPAHGEPVSASRGVDAFLAPERADGGPPTTASDLWALGATLHLAVTGRTPGQGPATTQEIPGGLRPVLDGLLARDPRKRLDPEAAHRLLAEIEPSAPSPATAPGGSRTPLIAGIAAAAVLAGAVGGWAVLRPGADPSGAAEPYIRAGTGASPAHRVSATRSKPASPAGATSPGPRLRLTWYTSPRGWRAGVPRDWKVDQAAYSTRWLDPEGRAQLSIEVTAQTGTDPVGMLRAAEAILRPAARDYHKLRLRPASSGYGTAADWEFTWIQRTASAQSHLAEGTAYHQARRVISTRTTTTVLTWTTVADDWQRLRPTLARVFALFRPPTG